MRNLKLPTRIPTAIALLLLAGGVSADPTSPNPAAVLCEKNGAVVTIEMQPNGSQRGICAFPNGTRIDEWAYFRNKHRAR